MRPLIQRLTVSDASASAPVPGFFSACRRTAWALTVRDSSTRCRLHGHCTGVDAWAKIFFCRRRGPGVRLLLASASRGLVAGRCLVHSGTFTGTKLPLFILQLATSWLPGKHSECGRTWLSQTWSDCRSKLHRQYCDVVPRRVLAGLLGRGSSAAAA